MTFQTTVFLQQGFNVPGEIYNDGPHRAQSYIINSATPANNIFGSAFTVSSQGVAQAGGDNNVFAYAGILIDPKNNVSFGTVAGGPLAPTLTLANNQQAQCLTMGAVVVTLPAAAAIGDYVIYNQTTGALSTITPGTALPGGFSFAQALVSHFTVTAAGLAVITLTPTLNNI